MSGSKRPDAYEIIYAVVRQIPRGRVATYGQIASLAGLGRRARLVGRALRSCRQEDRVPWQRVISSPGRIADHPSREGSEILQRMMLEAETVKIGPHGRIDLVRFGWEPGPRIMTQQKKDDPSLDPRRIRNPDP